jgi:hypothetical protein
MNYGLLEIVTLISGVFAIAKMVVWLYDSKVSTEREMELQKVKNDFLLKQDELQKRLEIQGATAENTVKMNTQAMQHLTESTNELKETIKDTQDQMLFLTKEQATLKASVKSAHYRIDGLRERGCDNRVKQNCNN